MKIMAEYESFLDLYELDVNQYIKDFGMMEKPLSEYTDQLNEYYTRSLEAEVRTHNIIDCILVRVLVSDFKQSFIDRALYICTRLKNQVMHLFCFDGIYGIGWYQY